MLKQFEDWSINRSLKGETMAKSPQFLKTTCLPVHLKHVKIFFELPLMVFLHRIDGQTERRQSDDDNINNFLKNVPKNVGVLVIGTMIFLDRVPS